MIISLNFHILMFILQHVRKHQNCSCFTFDVFILLEMIITTTSLLIFVLFKIIINLSLSMFILLEIGTPLGNSHRVPLTTQVLFFIFFIKVSNFYVYKKNLHEVKTSHKFTLSYLSLHKDLNSYEINSSHKSRTLTI